MTGDEREQTAFANLSEQEMRELAASMTEVTPEVMTQTMGLDVSENLDSEAEQELTESIVGYFEQMQQVETAETREEQSNLLGQLFDTMVAENFVADEADTSLNDIEGGGIGYLARQLETVLENSHGLLEAFDRAIYYESLDALIEDAAANEQLGAIQHFYDNELTTPTRQVLVQRLMNPIAGQYIEWIVENPEVTDRDELEEYADIYREIAGLYEKLIAQLVAVIRLSEGKDSDYDHLSSMSLNNLMQKVGSKTYSDYNVFAEGFDRQIRNALAHTEYAVNPVNEEMTFWNRGEEVAVLSYDEFQEVVLEALIVTYSLWHLQLMVLRYYFNVLRGFVAGREGAEGDQTE